MAAVETIPQQYSTRQLAGRAKCFAFVCNKLCVFLNEKLAGWPKIKLLGMIAKIFSMNPGPYQAAVSIYIYLGDTKFGCRKILVFVNSPSSRIEFTASGVNSFHLFFGHA